MRQSGSLKALAFPAIVDILFSDLLSDNL